MTLVVAIAAQARSDQSQGGAQRFAPAAPVLFFETQRQWTPRAIGRTSPCLLGLFSLVVLMAKTLYPHSLPVRQNAWYSKEEATFSDALAAVRAHLWGGMHYTISSQHPQTCLIPMALWDRVQQVLCYAA